MMYGYENERSERPMSRSDKIMEAKSAFGQNTVGHTRGYSRGNDFLERYPASKDTASRQQGKHHFGMLRMVIAGMLFLVLVTAFHFQVSYSGFNKEYLQTVLEDQSHWNHLVDRVTQVMSTIQK